MKQKPNMGIMGLWNLSFGFFGVQIAYALQSANISRIFATLGADPHNLSYFWILPPLMGILVQPIVGTLSDKTWCRFGRRIPYLFIGATVAVLGCGIDVVYPPENKKIFDKIKDNGMIISEYYPGTKPNPAYFPCRNRIISGLVNGIVVVEAAEKSGALITAELALSEGRDIFAVPGSIFAEQSRGCNALIKQGAKLVQSSQDILEEYPWAKRIKATEQLTVTPEENAILRLLSAEVGSSIDELVLESQFDISAVNFILLQLELRGLVIKTSYQSYIKIAKEVVF